jgi:hypothetical protein
MEDRYFDMAHFTKDWREFSYLPVVKFYWGYGEFVKISIVSGPPSVCAISIGEKETISTFVGLGCLVRFIQNVLDEHVKHLIYTAFHNFFALAKKHNACDMRGELRDNRATLSCKFPSESQTFFEIERSNDYSKVDIRLSGLLPCWCSPIDVLSMQKKFFPTQMKRIRSESQGGIYDLESNSIGERGVIIEFDPSKPSGPKHTGRIPGDLEGLGTPIFYLLAFGGIVIIGSTIISAAVSIYNGIVSKKSK